MVHFVSDHASRHCGSADVRVSSSVAFPLTNSVIQISKPSLLQRQPSISIQPRHEIWLILGTFTGRCVWYKYTRQRFDSIKRPSSCSCKYHNRLCRRFSRLIRTNFSAISSIGTCIYERSLERLARGAGRRIWVEEFNQAVP